MRNMRRREQRTGRGFIHGWIVGLGIFLMSRLQDSWHAWIADLMDRLALPYRPRDMNLTLEDVAGALLTLHARTREYARWWSIIDARGIGPDFVEAVSTRLRW